VRTCCECGLRGYRLLRQLMVEARGTSLSRPNAIARWWPCEIKRESDNVTGAFRETEPFSGNAIKRPFDGSRRLARPGFSYVF
jgi:hypothetical protein